MILVNSNNDLWRIWLCGLYVPLSRTLSTYSRLWRMPCWWMLLSDASSPRKLFMLLLNWPTSTLWNRKVCNDKPFLDIIIVVVLKWRDALWCLMVEEALAQIYLNSYTLKKNVQGTYLVQGTFFKSLFYFFSFMSLLLWHPDFVL